MKSHLAIATSLLLFITGTSDGEEFRHVGDYLLNSHFKLTGSKKTPIPMKPIAFRVYTDGVTVKVSAEGEEDAHTKFEIYRSDGISRQRTGGGAIEIIPGIQATSMTGGVFGWEETFGWAATGSTFATWLPGRQIGKATFPLTAIIGAGF